MPLIALDILDNKIKELLVIIKHLNNENTSLKARLNETRPSASVPITDSSFIEVNPELLYELENNITITKTSTMSAPILIGIPKSIFIAIAPPSTSAKAVEIAANTDVPSTIFETEGLKYSCVASAKHLPDTMPICAALCCKNISIIVDSVTTHKSEYPNDAPAATLDAQFPGSINPTVTISPGPRYLKSSDTLFIYGCALKYFGSFSILSLLSLIINLNYNKLIPISLSA